MEEEKTNKEDLPILIALLSTGKGTWAEVNRLIKDEKWQKIILVTNEFGIQNFSSEKPAEFVVIDSNKSIIAIQEDIEKQLKDKIEVSFGTEVVVNIVSGTGKEHMALMSVIIKLGAGFRFVTLTQEGIRSL